jgi:hypothetical protein
LSSTRTFPCPGSTTFEVRNDFPLCQVDAFLLDSGIDLILRAGICAPRLLANNSLNLRADTHLAKASYMLDWAWASVIS